MDSRFTIDTRPRILMRDGKWARGVPKDLKARYSQPRNWTPEPKRTGPAMYIERPDRTPKPKATSQAVYRPDITRQAIEQLQGEGLTRAEIAKRMGCSASLITVRMRGAAKYRAKDALIPRALTMRQMGATFKEIGLALGVDKATAKRICERGERA